MVDRQVAELLASYIIGIDDELDDNPNLSFDDELHKSAYLLGRLDAVAGDVVASLNYRSDEQVFNSILEYHCSRMNLNLS